MDSKEYPYGMIYFVIDENITIAVVSDPLSPRDFMDKNYSNRFMVNFSIPPRNMFTVQGQKKVYYARLVETNYENKNQALELEFVFTSSDHLRYENGRHVSGPHGGAPRAVKVEENISGNEGYTVTMFNTDGGKAFVQMAPKQMKLISADNEKIQLRGYGRDAMGSSFSDYGLTIYQDKGNIEKCILHMFDRGVDIEYLP